MRELFIVIAIVFMFLCGFILLYWVASQSICDMTICERTFIEWLQYEFDFIPKLRLY